MALKHNRSWYTKKLVDIAKWCAKERDMNVCQWCKAEVSGCNAHGSHVLNVGTNKSMELDPENIKCLCYHCHMNRWHKDVLAAAEWFKSEFPDRYDYLMEMRKAKIKIPTVYLEELYEHCRGDKSAYPQKYYEIIQRVMKETKK